eukprot:gene11064-42245_t
MAVSCDIGDPASVLLPLHPPFKREIARRLMMSIVHGDASVPSRGPEV